MYYFNKLLFRNLAAILNRTPKDIANEAGVSRSTWRKWMETLNPTVNALVRLCNAEHISISYFFTTSPDMQMLPDHMTLVSAYSMWVDIEFRSNLIASDLTENAERTVKDALKLIGISKCKFYGMFYNADDTTHSIQMDDLLNVCNKAMLYPGNYVIDINRSIDIAEGFSEVRIDMSTKLSVAKRRIAELTEECAQLRKMLQRALAQQGMTYQMRAAEDNNQQ